MKLSTLLSASLIGFAAYLLMELLWGSYGFVAYRELTAFVATAEDGLAEQEAVSRTLEGRVHDLTTDADTVRLEARAIGYLDQADRVVRFPDQRVPSQPPSRAVHQPEPPPQSIDNRPLSRAVAVAIALLYVLVETLALQSSEIVRERRRRSSPSSWEVEVDDEFSAHN